MRSLRQAGGEVVKEIYAPLSTADFAPYLAKVGGLGADAVYAWFAGADAIRFVKAYKECGLAGKLPLYHRGTHPQHLPGGHLEVVEQVGP